MKLCKTYLFVTIICGVVFTENDIETTTTFSITDVICNLCACANNVLDCRSKGITSPFQSQDWEGVKELNPTEINFSNNTLKTFKQIPKLPVRLLNLSSCQLEDIDNHSFKYLVNHLASLDLSRNMLTTSSLKKGVFAGQIGSGDGMPIIPFKKLHNLSLAYNNIHSLPQYIFFFMSDIRCLDLSGNPMGYIDQVTMGAISDLTSLTELRLSGCELESLPKGILRRQFHLRVLGVSSNRFTTIPEAIGDLVNIVYLNLNGNPIENLQENSIVSNLTKLKELRLSRMTKLRSVSAGALGGLENLEILDLSNNPRLSVLDPGSLMWVDDHEVERWPILKEIYLNNNNLSQINSHLLDRWDLLVRMDFTHNPYVCDCNNQWMVQVLVPLMASTAMDESANNMICKKPPELRGISFAQLRQKSTSLICLQNDNFTDISVPNAAVILGIMIGIMITFSLMFIILLLWKRGFFAKCRNNLRKNYDDEDEEF